MARSHTTPVRTVTVYLPESNGIFQPAHKLTRKKPGTNGKPKGDYRSKYLWVVERSDKSKKHELVLPWVTNLKSATFKTITAIEIDDDDKIIPICIPFIGCFAIKDPFQNEDEVGIELNVNNSTLKSDSKDMEEDAVYEFPKTWPGAPSMNEAAGAYYPGAKGYTVNFTGSAWVRLTMRMTIPEMIGWLRIISWCRPAQRAATTNRQTRLFTIVLPKPMCVSSPSSGGLRIPGQVSLGGNSNIAWAVASTATNEPAGRFRIII